MVTVPLNSANTIAVNINLHAGPCICLLIDLSLNCIEFPKRHYYVTLVFGTIYMVINMRIHTVLYSLVVAGVRHLQAYQLGEFPLLRAGRRLLRVNVLHALAVRPLLLTD